MITIIALQVFFSVAVLSGALVWMLIRQRNAALRLRRVEGESTPQPVDALSPEAISELLEKIARPINRIAPPSHEDTDKLQRRLIQAGYFSPRANLAFRGIQFLGMVVLPATVGMVFYFLDFSRAYVLLGVLISFSLGFLIPKMVLDRLINARQRRLTWGLADALDLMVVSMEAGLGINAAMVKVSEELAEAWPDISEEFALVNVEIRIGRDRAEALKNLGERTAADDLRNFVIMLIQADRFGTSIAAAVRAFADSLRTLRRQRAEQAAQRASVKLLLPLTLFLFPVLFIVILGPAALSLIDSFGAMSK
jgi:tight adherence protein C